MHFHVVIPARFGSERLPGKPLADVGGRPLIRWVCECALAIRAANVIVATDDARVGEACRGLDLEVCMTAADHPSGTDRIAEVVRRKHLADDAIVVNLQGDEPLMPPATIDQVATLLAGRPEADMATLSTPIHTPAEFLEPSVVKVVLDCSGRALYFSRAPIPWRRADGSGGGGTEQRYAGALRHVGLYAYHARTLRKLAGKSRAPLEAVERLEQLRALWLGLHIMVDIAREVPGPSVDTPADLEKVSRLLGEVPDQ
jgi:3-deoxy-manno-octulosonate cytidylyltransferase (CMP-KDO synthetase)